MPIYEYVCGKCARKTEVIQRMNEAPLKVCPHCGGRLKKAFSAPAIQFKGSGWYVTDYARAKREERKSGGDGESGSDKSVSGSDKSVSSGKSKSDASSTSESKSGKKPSGKSDKKKD
jgi:putative FmdB family regulatory protein